MSTAALAKVASAGSTRLLAHVNALDAHDAGKRTPALIRLEAALGRDFADRLLAALSDERTKSS